MVVDDGEYMYGDAVVDKDDNTDDGNVDVADIKVNELDHEHVFVDGVECIFCDTFFKGEKKKTLPQRGIELEALRLLSKRSNHLAIEVHMYTEYYN